MPRHLWPYRVFDKVWDYVALFLRSRSVGSSSARAGSSSSSSSKVAIVVVVRVALVVHHDDGVEPYIMAVMKIIKHS